MVISSLKNGPETSSGHIYQDGDNAYDRLEGLETEFADWHAKLNLYMVCSNFILEL